MKKGGETMKGLLIGLLLLLPAVCDAQSSLKNRVETMVKVNAGGDAQKEAKIREDMKKIDDAYERSRNSERIRTLRNSGVSITKANTQRRAVSSGSIGGAARSSVSYGSRSSSGGGYSSGYSSSNSSSSTPNPRYAKEAERDLQQMAEYDARMQECIAEGANFRSKDVGSIIAEHRGGVTGNRDDGEVEAKKPKGLNVPLLAGIKKTDDKQEPEEAKQEEEAEEELTEYDKLMIEYLDKWEEDETSLTNEQLNELRIYLEKIVEQ